MFKQLVVAVFCLFFASIYAQIDNFFKPSTPEFILQKSDWADSVLKEMSLDEKIGQLFMVAAYSSKDEAHYAELEQLITQHHIGGLIFFKGSPIKQANLTNRFQEKAKTPLFIAIDGEWGLSMRLDSTVLYPRQMMLGALPDDQLIYEMGKQIADQCKLMGIHINFAPVIDVNNNAKNPVINNRSFGEVKEIVARYGIAYMNGMQEQHVLACGKHFPGHGDTDMDSHKSLPTIPHDFARLDSLELYPFKELINQRLASMMVAHLYIPSLDATNNQASTLSPKIVNGLLKDSLGFEGLVFTDALNMEGVAAYYQPGEVDVKAILAGNDVLLFPLNVPVAIKKIKEAITKGEITEADIDERCLKILKAKAWAELDNYQPINTEELISKLNPVKTLALNKKIAKQSITLIKNDNNSLPLAGLDTIKTVYLNVGGTKDNPFYTTMNYYTAIPMIQIPRALSANEEQQLLDQLKPFDRIIIGFHRTTNNPKTNFGITRQAIGIHEILSKRQDVISVIFGNPYVLDKFGDLSQTKAIVIGYQDTDHTNEAAAQLIFGGLVPKGKLPVTGSDQFPAGTGLTFEKKVRLSHVIPEEIGISSDDLYKIDKIAENSIYQEAFPGCQIVAIKDGNVFYNKAFGYHTYDKKRKVETGDIYDLASITKIASTTITLVKLQKDGLIDIDNNLYDYLPELVDSTPYKRMVIRQMLAHQAGLQAWLPFYVRTVVGGHPNPEYYTKDSNAVNSYRVANDLYISPEYEQYMLKRITQEPLRKKTYKYSDMGYYFLKFIIEKQTGTQLEDYVADNFYKPMGLSTMGYHPRYRFPLDRITPTEMDTAFRDQLVWGDVHDPGAAMQGGVGGHAGLFSNALDLGTLMYMLINDGEYGGVQYLDKDTLADFTRCQFCPTNRRGAGFDKPVRSLDGGPTCNKVSLSSFGHSGFTGTITWADPEKGIVYVFLSNRVYPNAENWKIVKEGIRTEIQDAIYVACEKK
ncbi:MAG: glycoside hydrolase family 3 N-terminal domain-containing protein [Crocinitomicaceae bacterium]|nr:serine hydrolase [Crocinitomicaceae bacterium]